MAIFFPTSEFFESSGNAANQFSEDLRDGIVTFACNIWANYPGFVTKGTNPVSSFARGFMNSACSPIQPPVPAPAPPFLGGQCEGDPYDCTMQLTLENMDGSFTPVTLNFGATGAVIAIGLDIPTTGTDRRPRAFVTDNGPDNPTTRILAIYGNPVVTGVVNSITVTRSDGQPDVCGNPPSQYPPFNITQNDVTTNIVINNDDGTVNNYKLEFNQIDNNYNFPLNFKIGGSNVVLDVGGITIFGDTNISTTNIGNDSPPPGSGGGQDVDGNPIDTTNSEIEYPTFPPPAIIEPVQDAIEYLLCQEGVIENIQETIVLAPNLSPIVKVILLLLSNIVEDICEEEATEVGFPDVYPVLPGVERPALVFYYKEFVDEKKQRSTYTATVSNPLSTIGPDLDSLEPPDRELGKFVAALKLGDGSRIVSSGVDEAEAIAFNDYMLSLVSPELIPPNPQTLRSVTRRELLKDVEVKCVQIEWYPNGKQQGISPAAVRRIDPFE